MTDKLIFKHATTDKLAIKVAAFLGHAYGPSGNRHCRYDLDVAAKIIEIIRRYEDHEFRHISTFSMSAPIEDVRAAKGDGGGDR